MTTSRPSTSGPERRRHPRFATNISATLVVGGIRRDAATSVDDVSETGLAFTAGARELRPNWLISIGFLVGSTLASGTGRIVRATGDGRFGVELDDATEALRAFIRRLETTSDPASEMAQVSGFEIRVA